MSCLGRRNAVVIVTEVIGGLAYVWSTGFKSQPYLDQRRKPPCQQVFVGDWLTVEMEGLVITKYKKIEPKRKTRADSANRVRMQTAIIFSPNEVQSYDRSKYCWSVDVGKVEHKFVEATSREVWETNIVYDAWVVWSCLSTEENCLDRSSTDWSLPQQSAVVSKEQHLVSTAPWNKDSVSLENITISLQQKFEGIIVMDYDQSFYLVQSKVLKIVLCPKLENLRIGEVINFRVKPSCKHVQLESGQFSLAADDIQHVTFLEPYEILDDGIRIFCRAPVQVDIKNSPPHLLAERYTEAKYVGKIIDPHEKLLCKMTFRNIEFCACWRKCDPLLWTIDEIMRVEDTSRREFATGNFKLSDGTECIENALGFLSYKGPHFCYIWSYGFIHDLKVSSFSLGVKASVGNWVRFSARRPPQSSNFILDGNVELVSDGLPTRLRFRYPEVQTTVVDTGKIAKVGTKNFRLVFSEDLGYVLDEYNCLPFTRGTLMSPDYYKVWVVLTVCKAECRWKISKSSDFVMLKPKTHSRESFALASNSVLPRFNSSKSVNAAAGRSFKNETFHSAFGDSCPSFGKRLPLLLDSVPSRNDSIWVEQSSPIADVSEDTQKLSQVVDCMQLVFAFKNVENIVKERYPRDYKIIRAFLNQCSLKEGSELF